MIDIVRRPEAPAGLARPSLRTKDLRAALHEDFLGKCYLCEGCVTLDGFEIEHRKPRGIREFEHLEFEWTNLFPACERCNGARPRYPTDGLASPGENVEGRLVQCMGRSGPVFAAVDDGDLPARNTALELHHLHHRSASRAADLRDAIWRHIVDIFQTERRMTGASKDPSRSREAEQERARLRRLLARDAPFTMLARSEFPYLADLFD